jgi:hypothetical protein
MHKKPEEKQSVGSLQHTWEDQAPSKLQAAAS